MCLYRSQAVRKRGSASSAPRNEEYPPPHMTYGASSAAYRSQASAMTSYNNAGSGLISSDTGDYEQRDVKRHRPSMDYGYQSRALYEATQQAQQAQQVQQVQQAQQTQQAQTGYQPASYGRTSLYTQPGSSGMSEAYSYGRGHRPESSSGSSFNSPPFDQTSRRTSSLGAYSSASTPNRYSGHYSQQLSSQYPVQTQSYDRLSSNSENQQMQSPWQQYPPVLPSQASQLPSHTSQYSQRPSYTAAGSTQSSYEPPSSDHFNFTIPSSGRINQLQTPTTTQSTSILPDPASLGSSQPSYTQRQGYQQPAYGSQLAYSTQQGQTLPSNAFPSQETATSSTYPAIYGSSATGSTQA